MSTEQKILKAIRRFLFFGAIFLAIALWVVQWWLTHSRKQPIAFSHKIHAGDRGISCFYCHTGVQRGDIAGVPSVQDCMQCHQVVAPNRPEVQKLTAYWEKKKSIEWFKVYKVPKHVHFSHRVHLAFLSKNNPNALHDPGKYICIKCHGDVARMPVVAAPASAVKLLTGNMNPNTSMGFCVDCHRANNGPMDCTACHQ